MVVGLFLGSVMLLEDPLILNTLLIQFQELVLSMMQVFFFSHLLIITLIFRVIRSTTS